MHPQPRVFNHVHTYLLDNFPFPGQSFSRNAAIDANGKKCGRCCEGRTWTRSREGAEEPTLSVNAGGFVWCFLPGVLDTERSCSTIGFFHRFWLIIGPFGPSKKKRKILNLRSLNCCTNAGLCSGNVNIYWLIAAKWVHHVLKIHWWPNQRFCFSFSMLRKKWKSYFIIQARFINKYLIKLFLLSL